MAKPADEARVDALARQLVEAAVDHYCGSFLDSTLAADYCCLPSDAPKIIERAKQLVAERIAKDY